MWKRKSLQLFLVFAAIVFSTFLLYKADLASYGVTWDEFFHRGTGQMYTEFLRKHDLSTILKEEKSPWLPPLASTIGYIFLENETLRRFIPVGVDRYHLSAGFFGSLTVGFVFLIGYFLFQNIIIAIVPALLLATHTQFITNAHTNVRDMGMTMFFTFSILVLLLTIISRRRLYWMSFSGILAGLTTDAKQNGLMLLIIGFIWFSINIRIIGVKKFIAGTLLFVSLYIITFFLFWPFMWVDTVSHLISAWKYLSEPTVIAGTLTFYDRIYHSMKDIPVYYPWVMLAIVTTPIISLLAASGLVLSLRSYFLKDKKQLILFLWIFIPLARFFFPISSISHDQIRHFLEVLPVIPLAATATLCFGYLKSPNTNLLKAVMTLVIIIALLYNVSVFWRYKPYGNAYFNFMAGPSYYVNHAFDIEYWGSVYREAVSVLSNRFDKNTVLFSPGMGVGLFLDNGYKGKLTEDFKSDFDYVFFMNKQNWIRQRPYLLWLLANKKPAWTIEREGKVLFYLFASYKEEYLKRSE